MRAVVWVERLLLLTGIVLLLWCAWAQLDAHIAQRQARAAFETMLAGRITPPRPGHRAIVVQPRARAVAVGAPVAALTIPRIRLSAMVLHGSDAQTLRRGPGHLENTAFPGEAGNVVIAGHRDSFFWPLHEIRVGDDIFLDASTGPSHYRVTSIHIVDPHDVSVVAPTPDPVLTLITCYPFTFVGAAPDRFIVRAVRVDRAPLTVAEYPAQPSGSTDLARVYSTAMTVLAPPERSVVQDDEGVIRDVVRTYLRSRGADLAGGRRLASGIPAYTCQLDIGGESATADCDTAADELSEQQIRGRIFTLEKVDDAWAIKAIALK